MKSPPLVLVLLTLCALCACDARLALSLVGDGVDLADARIQVEVHPASTTCSSFDFATGPTTAPTSVAVVGAGSLLVPRKGDKLVFAEASNTSGVVVGRGCTLVGDVDDNSSATLTITPTSSLRDLPDTTPVFGDDEAGVVRAVVVDASDAPRPGVFVQARASDGFGNVLVEQELVSDDEGVIAFAPPLHASGPVRVQLVPQQPRTEGDVAVLDAWVAAPVADLVLEQGSEVLPFLVDDVPGFVAAHQGEGVIVLRRFGIDSVLDTASVPDTSTSVRLLAVNHHRSLGDNDVTLDIVWLQTATRLLAVDLATLIVVDELAMQSAVTAVAHVGACAAPQNDGPLLMTSDGSVDVVDLAFGRITFVQASADLRGAVRSGCVRSGSTVHRLLVADAGVFAIGGGIASIRVADVTPTPVVFDSIDTVVHIGFRDDDVALVVRFDGGSTIMTSHTLSGDTLVPRDDDNDRPLRLPATPVVVEQGPMFGGNDDVLALLPAGGPNDSAALYGRSGAAASGIVGMCSPQRACATSVVSDVDGDGVRDLLTVATTSNDVRARVVRSR